MKSVCIFLTFLLPAAPVFGSQRPDGNRTSESRSLSAGRSVLKPNVVAIEDLMVPQSATAQLREAEKDAKAARPNDALRHLRKAVEIYPKFSPAHNNMGLIYFENGKAREAEQAFLKAVETGANNVCAHRNLGYLYLMQDRPKEAITPLSTAARMGDPDADTLGFLGEALYLERRYSEAADTFRQALTIEPRLFAVTYRLACAEARMGRFQEALVALKELQRCEHPGLADSDIEALKKALEANVKMSSR